MQIKIAVKYHFTAVRLAHIKKYITTSAGVDMWEKGSSSTVGRNVWFSFYGKNVWIFLKKLSHFRDLEFHLPFTPKTPKIILKTLQSFVYYSSIHSSQDLEIAYVYKKLMYMHNGILFFCKERWSHAACFIADGTRGYHAKCNQRETDK